MADYRTASSPRLARVVSVALPPIPGGVLSPTSCGAPGSARRAVRAEPRGAARRGVEQLRSQGAETRGSVLSAGLFGFPAQLLGKGSATAGRVLSPTSCGAPQPEKPCSPTPRRAASSSCNPGAQKLGEAFFPRVSSISPRNFWRNVQQLREESFPLLSASAPARPRTAAPPNPEHPNRPPGDTTHIRATTSETSRQLADRSGVAPYFR